MRASVADWRRAAGCARAVGFLVVLLLALAPLEAARAQVSDVDVGVFRSRRGPELTLVDGVVQFDPRVVEGGEDCAYLVGIEVRDSEQLAILQDGWRGLLACEPEGEAQLSERAVRVVETFQFAVMPGHYSLEVSLEPAGHPEAATRVDLDLESLPSDAVASDLILGREVGYVDTTDTGRWTVRRGQVGIAADPCVVADATRSTLAYYLEVYSEPEGALQGEVEGVIRRANGDQVIRSKLAELQGEGGIRSIAGAMSLAGLPPGDYALDVQLKLTDTLVSRWRGFQMAAAFDPPVAARGSETLRDYFWGLSDEELAELFDPIEVWLGPGEERRTYRNLPPEGKRQFLVVFFERVAAQIVGRDESALDVYLERVRYVNETFGERVGREEQAGWHTDRGRIYLLRGRWDRRLERPFPRDRSAPYEIWSYNVGPGYVYLFVDETLFRNYRLLFSTDPREPALPEWETRVSPAALEELDQYFGVRPRI